MQAPRSETLFEPKRVISTLNAISKAQRRNHQENKVQFCPTNPFGNLLTKQRVRKKCSNRRSNYDTRLLYNQYCPSPGNLGMQKNTNQAISSTMCFHQIEKQHTKQQHFEFEWQEMFTWSLGKMCSEISPSSCCHSCLRKCLQHCWKCRRAIGPDIGTPNHICNLKPPLDSFRIGHNLRGKECYNWRQQGHNQIGYTWNNSRDNHASATTDWWNMMNSLIDWVAAFRPDWLTDWLDLTSQ